MKLLIKELEPTGGEIRVAGRDLAKIPRQRVPYYRRNLGVIFQDYKLLPNRTVYENVAYALQVTGGGRREIRDKVPDILRLTGLSTKLHNYPDQLSGGEQQRVAIARAFVNHPPLLIADEPTGNLDPETSIGIMQLLYRINQTGTTVLVATHDVAMVDKMRRRVIELADGKIVRDEQAGAYAARENTREFAVRMRGAQDEARLLPARGAAGAQAQRDPELRRHGHGARHRARARRLPPGRAGDHRRGQRGPRQGDRRRLPQGRRQADGHRSRRPPAEGRAADRHVVFISKAQALQDREEAQPEGVRAARLQPAAGHASASRRRNPDDIGKIKDALAPAGAGRRTTVVDPAIDEVRNREEDTNKILSVTRVVKITMALLPGLLGVASVLLIANTIRLSLYARRREVEVMKLVGATDWFIRWPFVLEGVIVGALGGLLAVLLLVIKIAVVDPLAKDFALIAAPDTIDFRLLIGLLLLSGVAVSALGSGLSLRKFLRV